MPRVGVVGAAGKMGKTLVEMIQESPDLALAAAVDLPGLQVIGQDAGIVAGIGEVGVSIADDLAQVVADIDVLIDFTIAVATEKN
ncbi:MAG: 4-hydroxy-tetrahydrodipicolinate reductase, partial [Gammaproteobacteria bacterium]|nr:4-hydroxy-tetrahydrodipicolinate reductase [Gammaproteobacteria bacterium]